MPKVAKMTEERDHAKDNAGAWASSLSQMVAALECDYYRLQELREEQQSLADEIESALPGDKDTARRHLLAWDADHGAELRELTESATIEGDLMADAESARERIQESPLSVQVRSGWASVGDALNAEEFEILLTTGGPALRICGELGAHCEPSRAWLEYQDWGTGWTQYFDVEQSTLLTYCSVFYFGE